MTEERKTIKEKLVDISYDLVSYMRLDRLIVKPTLQTMRNYLGIHNDKWNYRLQPDELIELYNSKCKTKVEYKDGKVLKINEKACFGKKIKKK